MNPTLLSKVYKLHNIKKRALRWFKQPKDRDPGDVSFQITVLADLDTLEVIDEDDIARVLAFRLGRVRQVEHWRGGATLELVLDHLWEQLPFELAALLDVFALFGHVSEVLHEDLVISLRDVFAALVVGE